MTHLAKTQLKFLSNKVLAEYLLIYSFEFFDTSWPLLVLLQVFRQFDRPVVFLFILDLLEMSQNGLKFAVFCQSAFCFLPDSLELLLLDFSLHDHPFCSSLLVLFYLCVHLLSESFRLVKDLRGQEVFFLTNLIDLPILILGKLFLLQTDPCRHILHLIIIAAFAHTSFSW